MNINRKLTECKDRTNDGFCKCLTEQINQIKQFKQKAAQFNTDYDKIQVSNYNKLKAVIDSHNKYQEGYNKLKQDLTNFEGSLYCAKLFLGKENGQLGVIPDNILEPLTRSIFIDNGEWILATDAISMGCTCRGLGAGHRRISCLGGDTPKPGNIQEYIENHSLFKIITNCDKNPAEGLIYKYKYTKLLIRNELEKYNNSNKPILTMPVLDSLPIQLLYKLNLPSIDCCGNQVKVNESDSDLRALTNTQTYCTETTPPVQETFESTNPPVKEKYKPANTNTSIRINKGGMIGLSLSSLVIIVLVYFAYKYFKENKVNKSNEI